MKLLRYFTKGEWMLWACSVLAITAGYLFFAGKDALSFVASLIGVTSLIFNAKGNPVGQVLMVVFSILYGIISYGFRYYGEMITYLGMTMPMALFALIAWLKNPFRGRKAEVKVNGISGKEWSFAAGLTVFVTAAFYFVLACFDTNYLLPSTLSVTTSFLAAYLTFRRSPYFALVYAMNDVVLIVLWILASNANREYLSVVICFAAFLVNDLYGFISWRRMEKRQQSA